MGPWLGPWLGLVRADGLCGRRAARRAWWQALGLRRVLRWVLLRWVLVLRQLGVLLAQLGEPRLAPGTRSTRSAPSSAWRTTAERLRHRRGRRAVRRVPAHLLLRCSSRLVAALQRPAAVPGLLLAKLERRHRSVRVCCFSWYSAGPNALLIQLERSFSVWQMS